MADVKKPVTAAPKQKMGRKRRAALFLNKGQPDYNERKIVADVKFKHIRNPLQVLCGNIQRTFQKILALLNESGEFRYFGKKFDSANLWAICRHASSEHSECTEKKPHFLVLVLFDKHNVTIQGHPVGCEGMVLQEQIAETTIEPSAGIEADLLLISTTEAIRKCFS